MRKKIFGMHLQRGWKDSIESFISTYKKIPEVTVPLKIHIISAHLEDFLNKFSDGRGLGYFSEQTGEAIHQRFKPIFEKYKIKRIDSEEFADHLYKSVVEFSSINV